jgi:hypothetical protein
MTTAVMRPTPDPIGRISIRPSGWRRRVELSLLIAPHRGGQQATGACDVEDAARWQPKEQRVTTT